jgi:YD repeat-containing protein
MSKVKTLNNPNSANYNSNADWNGQNGNVTTVGSNGGPSYYGTYDQSGNVNEWNDLDGPVSYYRGVRSGSFDLGQNYLNSSPITRTEQPLFGFISYGFRLSSSLNPLNLSNFLIVGDANNNSDTTGFGAVNYNYQIGTYEVTNSEYVQFLNAIASADPFLVFNPPRSFPSATIDPRCGISQSGTSGNYTYSINTNMGDKPVNYLSWFQCARYCNWLHNGKPSGAQNSGTTEDGAYTLNGIGSGNPVAKNSNASYSMPTENEWYKAAYYTPNKNGSGPGYWLYATQSDSVPTAVMADSSGNGIIPASVVSPKIRQTNNNFKVRS